MTGPPQPKRPVKIPRELFEDLNDIDLIYMLKAFLHMEVTAARDDMGKPRFGPATIFGRLAATVAEEAERRDLRDLEEIEEWLRDREK